MGGVAFEPPSLGRRFGALLIDWALSVMVAALFSDPLRDGWPPVVVLIALYGVFLGLFTRTPGMWVSRLRCVSYPDGRRLGVPRALLRGVLLCLVVPPLVMDGLRRGWHDRLAGSIVVPAERRPAG
ncbi:MAG TPA: RDD family protein [Micromonosporaceae bacterium]|nr:RDD family protein [Micromonosporaceae bacterium]